MIDDKLKGRTIAVTGAAGFIGSHLVERLLECGVERVMAVDNMILGSRANLASVLNDPKFSFKELDVNEPGAFAEFLAQESRGSAVDSVWHLAANSDIQAGGRDPEVDLKLTFMTTYNVLKAMEELSIPRIVFASSSAIYGEHDKALTESAGPLFPISNYGAMKLASEAIISAALPRFLKQAWIYRFPNVVGGRATHGAIYDFLRKLRATPDELEVLGDGTQQKPYLHVSELIDGMVWIYQKCNEALNFFNIAPARGSTTVRFMAEAVVKAASPKAKIRYTGGSRGWIGDVPKFSYSIDKLRTTGWTPALDSDAAVERAISENLQ